MKKSRILENICRFFHVLAQFPLTISKRELDYYHEKMNLEQVICQTA